ncbi:MAG: hypothetical protein KAR35_06415, partial [Candidatus Heimdallarchaeota archaeon]|nr:hypothetical protein [Candidatus Heimdallarchaeota archaeon]MCK5048991.1 hypothetical protein [Candidatus Heimdallarchaeota archaeon]
MHQKTIIFPISYLEHLKEKLWTITGSKEENTKSQYETFRMRTSYGLVIAFSSGKITYPPNDKLEDILLDLREKLVDEPHDTYESHSTSKTSPNAVTLKLKVTPVLIKKIIEALEEIGCTHEQVTNEYEVARLKKNGHLIICYSSGS